MARPAAAVTPNTDPALQCEAHLSRTRLLQESSVMLFG
jgi:hypothetical protein